MALPGLRNLLLLVALVLCIQNLGVQGKVVYCAPTGSDTSGNGSLTNPFLSMSKASSAKLGPGDKIQLRGGVYHVGDPGSVYRIHGAENSYISIEPYPGEKPVIDASGFTLSAGRAPVFLDNCSYVSVSGLEVRNSNVYGAMFWNCDNITFSNNYIHNTSFQAITGTGNGMIIENNEVEFGGMANYMNPPQYANGGWPGIVMAFRRGSDYAKALNWTIRNNYIHDCWGEGIIGTFDGGIIQGNIVHDTWSVNIYLDGGLGASNLWVDSNFVYSTNSTYNRNGYPASGIEWSTELYNYATFPAENIVISNNLILHTGQAFTYWHDSANTDKVASTYTNISFIYNVIWEPYLTAISIGQVPAGYNQPANCNLLNNIISNGSFNIQNPTAWSVSHNNWVLGIPKAANETNTFSANPNFINPSVSAGVAGFKLHTGSSSIAKGVPTPLVRTDFWGTPRDPAHPSIGLYEVPVTTPSTSSQSTNSQPTNGQTTNTQTTNGESTSGQITTGQTTSSQSTNGQSTPAPGTTTNADAGQSMLSPFWEFVVVLLFILFIVW